MSTRTFESPATGQDIENAIIRRVLETGTNSYRERLARNTYIDSILEDLLIAVRIPVFSKRAKRALINSRNVRLYYWRTRAGAEVDFVLYGEETFLSIEVKNTTRPRARDLRGLKAFSKDYPEATPVLLYRGNERKERGGIAWIPVEDFFRDLSPDRSLFLEQPYHSE